MFTGIISTIGTIARIERTAKKNRVTCAVAEKKWRAMLSVGTSVSMDGTCVTIVALQPKGFLVDIARETERVTNIGSWKKGHRVNLELPVRANEMLSGHLLLGHVDGVGHVVEIYDQGNGKRLVVAPPPDLFRFLPYKGSIAVNGVSLTIANVDADKHQCIIALIPHTIHHTTLGVLKPKDLVNIEVDAIARYLDQLLEERFKIFEERLLQR
ncbi:riboflavin synthase [Candidatus Uhrbacteria bacterium]|nr:riboflavin synthase [Candidatus Uhrbacteria bacterium]